jgi:hypothetical protein
MKSIALKIIFTLFAIHCMAASDTAKKNITDLSHTFTERFLKNGYSQADIDAFKNFITTSGIKSAFYIYTFENNKWSMQPVIIERKDSYPHTRFAAELLTWLNTHGPKNLKKGMSFVYMPQEPLHECGSFTQSQQQALKALFAKCPILLTCTHPEILWSPSAILIPDPYIMHPKYQETINQIQQNAEHDFQKKQSTIFFRGAVSGPYSFVYRMESLQKDDRLKFFMLSKEKAYIDAFITDDHWVNIQSRVTPDFKQWYLLNLAHKRGHQADFIEHSRHKYLISMDGFGAAWSRVPYILFTGSVLFLRADCKQYFYGLLSNMKTYVDIDPGLTNLESVFVHLEQNPDVAATIGQAGREFARRYLTVDAINMYLSQVILDLNAAFKMPLSQQA